MIVIHSTLLINHNYYSFIHITERYIIIYVPLKKFYITTEQDLCEYPSKRMKQTEWDWMGGRTPGTSKKSFGYLGVLVTSDGRVGEKINKRIRKSKQE